MINIDDLARQAVEESGVTTGICHLFVPHTTAGVTINENADPNVVRDILMELNKVIPLQDNYTHMEGNAAAHIKSSLVGCSQTIPVEGGRLILGARVTRVEPGSVVFEQEGEEQRVEPASLVVVALGTAPVTSLTEILEELGLEYHIVGDAKKPRDMLEARGKPFLPPAVEGEDSPSRGKSFDGINIHAVRLPGQMAHQEVIFGGDGQTLRIRHDQISREAFMPGVMLAVKEVMKRKEFIYGLDKLLRL